MKNFILTNKSFYRDFLTSFSLVQHLIYGLLIPLLFLLSLLAWDPKVFVFIFLAYSCGVIGFMLASAMTSYQQNTSAVTNSLTSFVQTPKTDVMVTPSPLNLGNLMIAHDLKEPLRQVYCYAQLLEKSYHADLDASGKEYLQFVLSGAKRMQRMMEDISTLNQIDHQGVSLKSVDMNEILEDTLSTFELKIKDQQAQITHDPMPIIRGDEGQLRHLLLNLLGNALKYRGEANPKVHIRVDQEEMFCKLSVIDNGIGLSSQQLPEVFGLFRRLHAQGEYEGTGVGLAICKRIVEHHGGEIGVSSLGVGQGSTFWFRLPTV